jgi:hypothetical protein
VNGVETVEELRAFRRTVRRSGAFGDEAWTSRLVDEGLLDPVRPRGRPKKTPDVFLQKP